MGVHTPSWYILSSKATADIGYDALIPSVIFTALASCIVVLRIYCRAHHRSLAAEDLLIFLALLLSGAITGQVGGEFFLRGGYIKNNRVRAGVLYKMLNHVFSQSIFYHLAINFVKVSFVIQYYRLFSHIRTMVYCCYVLLVIIFGATCWGVFGVVFLCQPIQGYWNVLISSECMDAETHFWSSSIIGIILDWAVWFLPMPIVGRLRLPYRQKIGLFVVFGLGGFVCIVSILRFVLVYYFAHHGQVSKSGSYALIWSVLELNISIICASLLVLKPLYARFFPSMISEEPVSAREDARLWREATGHHRLQTSITDVEKWLNEDDDGRRDTVIGQVERHPRVLLAEPHRIRQVPRPRRAEVHPRRLSW